MFRLRSVSSFVIAPARTGSDSSSSRSVTAIDHTNCGIRSGFIRFGFTLFVFVIKFTAPRIEDIPAECSEKRVNCLRRYILIIIISYLSNDRSKASSKTIPPHSAIYSFLLQLTVSSPVLKVVK